MKNSENVDKLVNSYRNYFDSCQSFIEIGSRDGNDSDKLSKDLNIDINDIYIIEANEICYRNICKDFDYKCYYLAFGDEDKKVQFNKIIDNNSIGVSSALNRLDDFYDDKVEKTEVDMVRGDTFFKMENISTVDLVKIDVEGFGYQVLTGFGDRISDIKFIEVECELRNVWENQKIYEEVVAYMLSKDFTLVHEYNENSIQMNCHFLNNKYSK